MKRNVLTATSATAPAAGLITANDTRAMELSMASVSGQSAATSDCTLNITVEPDAGLVLRTTPIKPPPSRCLPFDEAPNR